AARRPQTATPLPSTTAARSRVRRRSGASQRSDDEQATTPEPSPSLQGEGGSGCPAGREDPGRTGPALRCPSQPDHGLEDPASRWGCRGVRIRAPVGGGTGHRREDAARQDRRVDADQRFFVRRARQSRSAERKAMIDRGHDLPIAKQAKALGISRGIASRTALRGEPDAAGSPQQRGRRDWPLPCRDADEAPAHRGTLPQTEHLEAYAGAQDLPVSAAGANDRQTQSGLGDGHHLRSNGAWVCLLGGRDRLVQPPGPVLAAIDHHGGRFLRGGSGRSARPARQAGDLQHRPGLAVHQPRLYQRAAAGRDRHQHGRQRRVARQRLRRTTVAVSQVRGDLPAGLRHHQAYFDRLPHPVAA
ncbi:hypothetical protein C1645_841921, partial [Glomus cerebriforme]